VILPAFLSLPGYSGYDSDKKGYVNVDRHVIQYPTHGSTTPVHLSTYAIHCNQYINSITMSQNTQQSFRSQLSSFRWANSVQDDSTPVAQQGNNVFSRTWTGLSGYIPLRNEGRSQEEEAYFALSVSGILIYKRH
jgi:hypothetical protein